MKTPSRIITRRLAKMKPGDVEQFENITAAQLRSSSHAFCRQNIFNEIMDFTVSERGGILTIRRNS